MPRITIPEATFEIPDDLEGQMYTYIGGQIAINAVIHVLGGEAEPGTKAIATDEILKSLSIGLAMLIAADTRNATPQAVRKDAEQWGRMIAGYAKILKGTGDDIGAQMLRAMNLRQEDGSIN